MQTLCPHTKHLVKLYAQKTINIDHATTRSETKRRTSVECVNPSKANSKPSQAIKPIKKRMVISLQESDNGSDHRVRTEDLPFQNHAQAGLRVHRIVIPRSPQRVLTLLSLSPPKSVSKMTAVNEIQHTTTQVVTGHINSNASTSAQSREAWYASCPFCCAS